MDRRHFLATLGIGAIGLSGPGMAVPKPLASAARPTRPCKIIGIGGAGRNIVVAAARSGEFLDSAIWTPEFICIDTDRTGLKAVHSAANQARPDASPVKTVALSRWGAGGWVNAARATASRNREALTSLLTDGDVVCLVAGLGGGTGSGVTPIMARLARNAGAWTVAAIITPFEYEGRRNRTSDIAIEHLGRETDCVMTFSNEQWSQRFDDRVMLSDVFSSLDRHIANSIGLRLNSLSS